MMDVGDFKDLIGRSVEDVKGELPPRYFIFVSQNDGESFYRSMDFNPYRINVTVKRGLIYKIDGLN